jgi:hypothetical protein
MPILQQLGIDPGQPTVMPVHKVIEPTGMPATKMISANRTSEHAPACDTLLRKFERLGRSLRNKGSGGIAVEFGLRMPGSGWCD